MHIDFNLITPMSWQSSQFYRLFGHPESRDHGTDHKSINLDAKALVENVLIFCLTLLTPFFHRQGLLCDQCVCLPGCVNGYCEDPMECICETGWQGMFCDKRKKI